MNSVANISCRSCGHEPLELIISFGHTPLADRLLTRLQLAEEELTAPLDLVFCPKARGPSTTATLTVCAS